MVRRLPKENLEKNFFLLIFCWTEVHLWGHWLPLFWTLCDPPHGFQSQGGSFTCTPTCLHVVNLRVMSGATPAFSTSRGLYTLYKYVCSRPTFWTSLMQAVEGRQWWMLTWAAVRFELAISYCRSTSKRAIHTYEVVHQSLKCACTHSSVI